MSKTKTLFTMALLVLLGSMGAAQAQDLFYEIKLFTTPADFSREGGKSEVSGDVLLNFTPVPSEFLTATLKYSAPLANNIGLESAPMGTTSTTTPSTSIDAQVWGVAEDEDNDDNGTITISAFGDISKFNLLVRGVMLDVSAASGPITVTVTVKSSGLDDFVRIDGQSSALVIEDIKVGVAASAKAETVRTRGTGADGMMVSLTLKESFKGAFMAGNMVTVDFSGIPEGVKLAAMVTSNPVADPDDEEDMLDMMDPYADAGPVKDGSVTVTLGGTGDLIDMRPAPASVKLGLTLTAASGNEKISFPLTPGSVMAKASFTDASGGDDKFEDAFTDYVTVFNIRPAQCELLFPVVTVIPASESTMWSWDTAISVANPAYGDEMVDGVLTFTFYGQDTEPAEFITSLGSPGSGLSLDGTLAAGGTYQVQASQILAEFPDWGTRFVGHVHMLADYPNCSGLGWVTNYNLGVTGGVNQAYKATVIVADTGADKNQ